MMRVRVTKYLPGDLRSAALAERRVEHAQSERHLVDDGHVVRGALVVHGPAAPDELNLPTFHQTGESRLCRFRLLVPPAPEEGSLHLDVPAGGKTGECATVPAAAIAVTAWWDP